MEYIYAAMLLNSAKKEINEANISGIIKAAGLQIDAPKIKSLVEALKDVDFEAVIKEASIVQIASAPAPSASTAPVAPKEEKKKEKTVEEASAGLGALFG